MMLSVLVWLAIWGQVQAKPYCEVDDRGMYCYNQPSSIWHAQAQTPDLSQLTDPGIVRPLHGCAETADHIICPSWQPNPPPAEHVIEIKTVRTNHRLCRANDLYDDHGCFVKTRELWIDNVKFGIIKGLD